MSISYLAESHGKIFEQPSSPNINPTNMADKEFRAFVENFNPWGYSRKQADTFQYGTGVMFELGAKCCLYQDSAEARSARACDTKLSSGVAKKSRQHGCQSFQQIAIADITDPKTYTKAIACLSNLEWAMSSLNSKNPNSSFYNEYFFMVDRAFPRSLE